MINYILFLLIIIISSGSLSLAADFREAEWGMSSEQVKLLEKTESVYPKKNALTFKGKIAGKPVDIIYEFDNNKLKSGTYTFTARNVNSNVYIQDYDKINEFLDIKYGAPESKKVSWNNDMYRDKKGFHGLALSAGHLSFESIWQEDKTTIIHKLTGINNTIDHSIYYYDKFSIDIKSRKPESQDIKGL
ncbi:MAG: hypothetical protein JZU65_07270 [Chlorobium sp.]|jgi:hypothetical protein|nr:hypothetical protein [Chlorobium sp.]